jgi:hypothetical protein
LTVLKPKELMRSITQITIHAKPPGPDLGPMHSVQHIIENAF